MPCLVNWKPWWSIIRSNSGISFSFTCIDPTLKLLADEQMITQVMLNLVKNASQALEGSRNPKIEIDAYHSDERDPDYRCR